MTTPKHGVPEELLSSPLVDYEKPQDLIGENGLFEQLTEVRVERALDAETTEHVDHNENEPVADPFGSTRSGRCRKTLKGGFGESSIDVPRDRRGSFEPPIVPKRGVGTASKSACCRFTFAA
jgi:putative transposase